ncbi:MAG: hypothetical protein JNK78_01540 [Planctomycetes bacterium]|nr:hypothetical protein [Planctomycetota bacterium]
MSEEATNPAPARPTAVLAAAVVAILATIALRVPSLWTHPRFWGEEGLRYFQFAWSRSLVDALTSVPQHYYNLGCQVSSQLALCVPLEHAPLVTTAFALLTQALPALLLLHIARRSAWSARSTAVAVAIAVFATTHDAWLSSTSSANHLVLAAALLLQFAEVTALGPFAAGILVAAALSTPHAFALLPIAVLHARLRSRASRRAAYALGAGLAIQASVMLALGLPTGRTVSIEPEIALAVLTTKCYVLPIAGEAMADRIGAQMLVAYLDGTFWHWTPLIVGPVILFWGALLRTRNNHALMLAVCSYTLVAASVVGCLGHKSTLVGGLNQSRYFMAANALGVLAALEGARTGPRGWARWVLGTFVACALIHWIALYSRPDPTAEGADWRTEVRAWRENPTHMLETRPNGWALELPPR